MSITCKPFFYKIKPKLITKHIQNAIALIRQFKDYVRQEQRRNDSQYKPMMCKMLIVACWRRYAKTDHIGCLSKVMDNVAARRAHQQPDLSKPAETKADKSRKSHQHRCKTGSPLTRRELLWLCFFGGTWIEERFQKSECQRGGTQCRMFSNNLSVTSFMTWKSNNQLRFTLR